MLHIRVTKRQSVWHQIPFAQGYKRPSLPATANRGKESKLREAEEGLVPNHYLDWSIKGKSALWRYAIAIVAGFVLWQFGSSVIMVLMAILTPGVQFDGPFFTYTFLAGLLMGICMRFLIDRFACLNRARWWGCAGLLFALPATLVVGRVYPVFPDRIVLTVWLGFA
jgi:hypothetical protein